MTTEKKRVCICPPQNHWLQETWLFGIVQGIVVLAQAGSSVLLVRAGLGLPIGEILSGIPVLGQMTALLCIAASLPLPSMDNERSMCNKSDEVAIHIACLIVADVFQPEGLSEVYLMPLI